VYSRTAREILAAVNLARPLVPNALATAIRSSSRGASAFPSGEMPGMEKVRRHSASGPCGTASVDDSGAGERAAPARAGPSRTHRYARMAVGSAFGAILRSLPTRTMIPTSANTVDSHGAVGRVTFIRYTKIVRIFSNTDRRVMFDSPIFGVIYKVQRHRCAEY
jgi:hypothetical protein